MTKTYRDFRNDLPRADTLTSAFSLTQDALAELFITRHKVYGPENIRLPGMAGIAVHLLDKWARVKGIVLDGHADEGETLEDSLADIAVYAIIGLMLKSGEWDLPCVERGDKLKAAILEDDYGPEGRSWSLACVTCGRSSGFYRWPSTEAGPFCCHTCVEKHTELKRAVISIAHDCDLESDACDCLDREDNSTVTGTDRGYHAFSEKVGDNLPKMTKGRQMPKIIGK